MLFIDSQFSSSVRSRNCSKLGSFGSTVVLACDHGAQRTPAAEMSKGAAARIASPASELCAYCTTHSTTSPHAA